jgi:hypothetical protein
MPWTFVLGIVQQTFMEQRFAAHKSLQVDAELWSLPGSYLNEAVAGVKNQKKQG